MLESDPALLVVVLGHDDFGGYLALVTEVLFLRYVRDDYGGHFATEVRFLRSGPARVPSPARTLHSTVSALYSLQSPVSVRMTRDGTRYT